MEPHEVITEPTSLELLQRSREEAFDLVIQRALEQGHPFIPTEEDWQELQDMMD